MGYITISKGTCMTSVVSITDSWHSEVSNVGRSPIFIMGPSENVVSGSVELSGKGFYYALMEECFVLQILPTAKSDSAIISTLFNSQKEKKRKIQRVCLAYRAIFAEN